MLKAYSIYLNIHVTTLSFHLSWAKSGKLDIVIYLFVIFTVLLSCSVKHHLGFEE